MKIPKTSSLLGSAVTLLAMAGIISTQAEPKFLSSTPTGRVQFENSSLYPKYTTFTAVMSDSVSTPITNLSITLTGTKMVGGSTFLRYGMWPGSLTAATLSNNAANTLTYSSFTGLKLENNVTYNAVIIAIDATSTNITSTNFDTIKPVFMWEAADYNFTPTNADGSFSSTDGVTNSGQHIDGPAGGTYTKTNAYRGLPASPDDAMSYVSSGNLAYRPQMAAGSYKSGIGTEKCSDIPRPPFFNTATNGFTNFNLSYHVASNFVNYTHVLPTSEDSFYVFARIASPNAAQSNSIHMYDQGGNEWGWFGNPKTGDWQRYTWVPLVDPTGTGAYVTFPTKWYGNNGVDPQMITMKNDTAASQGNLSCFIFLSGNITVAPPSAVITNFNPNGNYQFQCSNELSFTIKGGSVVQAGVLVRVVTTNIGLTRVVTTNTYVGGSSTNLTFKGSAGNWTVSLPLQTNKLYGITVQATDSSGNDAVVTAKFDTMNPAFLWDAEDWDFNAGQWATNGGVNAYQDFTNAPNIAITNVDFGGNPSSLTACSFLYRYGLDTEECTDPVKRGNHTNAAGQYVTDYDLGYNTVGNWANYTRKFPTNYSGTTNVGFNIFARAASPSTNTDIGSLYVVTSGVGLNGTNQVTEKIGYYGTYGITDYHTGQWSPVFDAGGNLAIFKGGSTMTLRYTFDGNYANVNYWMLLPADPNVKNKPYIQNFTPDGTKMYQPSNAVTFVVYSQAGVVASNITVTVDGNVLPTSSLTCGTNSNILTVSAPVYTNTIHKVAVNVTDANGSVSLSKSIACFSTNGSYKIEAEDWDFNGGQYIDFSAYIPNCYSNYTTNSSLASITNVDFYRPNSRGTMTYRFGLATQVSADPMESDDHIGNTNNYDLGYIVVNEWCNYTRKYAAGVYTIFKRAATATANAGLGTFAQVTDGLGTTKQTTNYIGTFGLQTSSSGGWSTYAWYALTNSAGNLSKFNSDGTNAVTLRENTTGDWNSDYYMIMPWNSSIPEKPYFMRFTPDGSVLYQPSNTATFTAISLDPNFAASNVSIYLDGLLVKNATNSIYKTSLTNGFNFGFPVSVGRPHTAVLIATDMYGSSTNTINFQTFSKTNAYKMEIEDWDFNGGQFISMSNWTAGCYTDIVVATVTGTVTNFVTNRMAVTNIDFYRPKVNDSRTYGEAFPYRWGLANGTTVDIESDEYNTNSRATNYVTGYGTGGDWINFTRDFPVSGPYDVYLRVASPAWDSIPGPLLKMVTNGAGTTNQLCSTIGQFESFTNTGGWSSFVWCRLLNSNGAPLQWYNTNTTPITFKYDFNWPTNTGNVANPDYILFVPSDTATPALGGLYPDGTCQFQSTNKLSFSVTSTVGVDTNSIVITINGVAVNFNVSGTSSNWVVSVPLALNSNYVATILVTASNGSSVSRTIKFDTFSSTYYTWEAEDFDYSTNNSTGQFFDYPAVGAYLGAQATEGHDFHFYGTNNEPYTGVKYRSTPDSGNWVAYNWWFGVKVANDTTRTTFTGATTNLIDYDLEWFACTSWAHYTRHYPSGTYNVMARMRNVNAVPTYLQKVTNGIGMTESVSLLGTFYPTNQASFSGPWQSVMLMDPVSTNKYAQVTFVDNAQVTLRVETSTNCVNPLPVGSQGDSINLNYFMLVPVDQTTNSLTQPNVVAKLSGTTLSLSFASQSGAYYQVEYKTTLTDATWTSLGNKLTGTGSTLTATDTIGTTTRFYRVLVTNQ